MASLLTQVGLLKKYKISVRGQVGQHLLIDPNVQRKIVELVAPEKGEWVFEIGPGLGALTRGLLESGASVLAVEKDPRFLNVLREEFRGFESRLHLCEADILDCDIPALLEKKIPAPRKPVKVISNLPYYITAPILFLLIDYRSWFSGAVLTMQKEVAARILAEPGTKEYGRLSLMVRLCADPLHALDISPRCFTPEPEVDSSVLVLKFHDRLTGLKPPDEKRFSRLVQIAFSQRRKMLLAVLKRHKELGKNKEELERIFAQLRIPRTARAEDLLLKDFLALFRALDLTGF